MPLNLVLVRHGQSEANVIQKRVKEDYAYELPTEFINRHDSLTRLSARGVEQATAAGEWLRNNKLPSPRKFRFWRSRPATFDHYYTSPHLRACETAAHLNLNASWLKDDRWRERDWGEYGIVNETVREQMYPHSRNLKSLNEWYWCPPGGESLATGVTGRFINILDTMHREAGNQNFIAVTHGETMRVAQFVLERQTPAEWTEVDEDPNYKIENTQILHYSRINPKTGKVSNKIHWRRSICPWDSTKSWNNGEWVFFDRDSYTDKQLLEGVNKTPRLLK